MKMEHDAYRDAGVDIDLEARAIKSLISELTFRRNDQFGMASEIGHFAGLISFGTYVLALAIDGVGTKMLVADAMQDWSTVGIDCIAMNVNDLFVMNLEPVAFVDYIATSKLSIEQMHQIGKGLNEGAQRANISVVGGETATLKDLVTGLDLAGACLGIQEKDKVITGSALSPGDVLVGIPSSGIHSNGLTLARQMVEQYGSYSTCLRSGVTLGEELLRPTRIYADVLRICAETQVHGMCHITGGGLTNLNRLSAYGYVIEDPLPPQEIFHWIAHVGQISMKEMYRTFNMGMGYVILLPKEGINTVLKYYPDAKVVGYVTKEPGIFLEGEKLF